MTSNLTYLKKPNLKNPVALAGLPGIALIGKLSIEYLIEKLEAEKFAELTSDSFPGWAVREDGIVRGLKVNFYSVEEDGFDGDIILLTADAQASSPKNQYDLSQEIVDVLVDAGADTITTMAAFLEPDGKESPVVGAATEPETAEDIEGHGVELLTEGRVVGMNGLLVGLGAKSGMKGFCLLGTTEGKTKDPDASKEVLKMLSDIFDLDLDLSDFEDEVPKLPKFKPPKIKAPTVSGEESELSYIG